MLKRFGILLASLLWAAYAYSQAFDTGQVSGSARDASGSVNGWSFGGKLSMCSIIRIQVRRERPR